jgi:hypothetical protein
MAPTGVEAESFPGVDDPDVVVSEGSVLEVLLKKLATLSLSQLTESYPLQTP